MPLTSSNRSSCRVPDTEAARHAPGWLTEDQRFFLVNDEGDVQRFRIYLNLDLDVSDSTLPELRTPLLRPDAVDRSQPRYPRDLVAPVQLPQRTARARCRRHRARHAARGRLLRHHPSHARNRLHLRTHPIVFASGSARLLRYQQGLLWCGRVRFHRVCRSACSVIAGPETPRPIRICHSSSGLLRCMDLTAPGLSSKCHRRPVMRLRASQGSCAVTTVVTCGRSAAWRQAQRPL